MKEYTVLIAGLPHTVLMDEAEAKRVGAKPVETKQAPAPSNKARTAQTKPGDK
jgi:hypothetical protein